MIDDPNGYDGPLGALPGCIFAKALQARVAACECASRRMAGEASVVECRSPVARHNCTTLAALFTERARFALRLPLEGRPLLHQQAMRLQCGGLLALRACMVEASPGSAAIDDVHRLVQAAQQQAGSLTDLPWAVIVQRLQAWQPRSRRTPSP